MKERAHLACWSWTVPIVGMILGITFNSTAAPTPQFKLENPQMGSDASGMGCSVAMDGDTMIVGANTEDVTGVGSAGKVRVYVTDGMVWKEVSWLTKFRGVDII